jgi:MFS family permease
MTERPTTTLHESPPLVPATEAPRQLDRRYVTAAMMLMMVLASMEGTVSSTAMPTIIGQLHGVEHYAWVATIYLLASTIVMPLYGRLADILGRKRVIITAICLFTVGSLLASLAQSMPQLILCRAIQGLGAGGIMPVVLTILGDIFTLQERASVQGFFSAVWGTASLAGPALGAALVTTLGWRSIFWVNLPFGFIGVALLLWKYHDHQKPHSTVLDLPGAAAMAIGSTALLAALSLASLIPTAAIAALLVVAAVSVIAFLKLERISTNPLMPPGLLSTRSIGPALIGSFLMGLAVFAVDTWVPFYVQGARGGSAAAAAATVTPVMLAWAFSSFFAAPLVVRWGFRKTATVGAVLVLTGMLGLFLCAYFQLSQVLLTLALAVTGCGFGPSSMSYLLGAQDAAAWHQRGIITSLIAFFRTIGGALGVGLLGAVLNVVLAPDLAALKQRGLVPAHLMDPKLHSKISPDLLAPAQAALVHAVLFVFAAMILFAIAQIITSTLICSKKHEKPITAEESIESIVA